MGGREAVKRKCFLSVYHKEHAIAMAMFSQWRGEGEAKYVDLGSHERNEMLWQI